MTHVCRCDAVDCNEEYVFPMGKDYSEETLVSDGWGVLYIQDKHKWHGMTFYHFCPKHRLVDEEEEE